MKTAQSPPSRHIFTVSELTSKIKQLLERKYAMVWLAGEVSNLRIPASGHAYFTLKDAKAQISAVMFRGQFRQLPFQMEDGQSITGLGRVSVYEPRGTYQIILEFVEPKGIGALQVAFEQLKRKLDQEGLFDPDQKKALPLIPKSIAVVTTPSGAVIRDILKVLDRRYPNLIVDIFPVRVQGEGSDVQMVRAIEAVNRMKSHDLILLARGGGSLEDLAAFNSEPLARAIFASHTPIVSAIGHETDFTIADFVADVRASTPSVAAEIIVPEMEDLKARCRELKQRMIRAVHLATGGLREKADQLRKTLVHPGKKVQDARIHVDFLSQQMMKHMARMLESAHARLDRTSLQFHHASPQNRIEKYKEKVDVYAYKILEKLKIVQIKKKEEVRSAEALLTALNPVRILKRGYSITRTLPQGKIVRSAEATSPGQPLEIQLAEGQLEVLVDKIGTNKGQ